MCIKETFLSLHSTYLPGAKQAGGQGGLYPGAPIVPCPGPPEGFATPVVFTDIW